jgi:hypothetical protein
VINGTTVLRKQKQRSHLKHMLAHDRVVCFAIWKVIGLEKSWRDIANRKLFQTADPSRPGSEVASKSARATV